MSEPIQKSHLFRRRNMVIAGVFVVVIAWGLFRPDFRPDARLISISVREELIKLGFKAAGGITTASFETIESADEPGRKWLTQQRVSALDDLFTEKWTDRTTHGQREQVTGLYVGPFPVLRYSRQWLPIAGSLLPNHLWFSELMTAFSIEEIKNFPTRVGGSLTAKVTYEARFATGELAKTESARLHCSVGKLDKATTLNSRLPGLAARIDCTETPKSSTLPEKNSNPSSPKLTKRTYSHWYVLDHGWSIPFEGIREFKFEGNSFQDIWATTLTAFE